MPPASKKSPGTTGGILLIEEYQALAIAFRSALKKVATSREIHVVRSLREAEEFVQNAKPALLVLDFDPPPRGGVAFFKKMRAAIPDVRVLIVAAENAPTFAAERPGPPALHFIQKPFELGKFGAAIHALLDGPGEEAARIGTLRDLTLIDMIVLYSVASATMVLKIDAGADRTGEIHFADGKISHAAVMGQSGAPALKSILAWRAARFSEAERPTDAPHTIHGPWAPILADALRSAPVLSAEHAPRSKKARPVSEIVKRKLVVIDDTELLSIFVEDALSTAFPELEIASALSGLDGLSLVASMKPDLILLDYSLPDINGAEVCHRLLEETQTRDIPVIMMSGHAAEMAATAERFDNVIATIDKPFFSSALVDLVEQALTNLAKLSARRRRKPPAPLPKVEVTDEHPAKRHHNGKRTPPESLPPVKPIEPPVPPETSEATPPTDGEPVVAEPITNGKVAEKFSEPASAETPAVEERAEIIGPSFVETPTAPEPDDSDAEATTIDPDAVIHTAPAPPIPSSAFSRAAGVPAEIKSAKLNAVVLGLPLEVISVDFTIALRIQRIRARPFSPAVSIHVLPQALPGITIPEAKFELAQVELDAHGKVSAIRLAPAVAASDKHRLYHSAIDGVSMSPMEEGQTVRLTPTAVAPMRFELLALFEIAGVELSPEFRVAHLVLKSRGAKTRATLLPDVAQTGATFEIESLKLTHEAQIEELLLQAAEV